MPKTAGPQTTHGGHFSINQRTVMVVSCNCHLAIVCEGMKNNIRISALCFAVLLTNACRAETGWEREAAVRSPDGNLVAVVEYKGSAACCSDHSRLRLVELRKGTLGEQRDVIVKAANAKLRAHWENDDRLVVEACRATNYEAVTRIFRRVGTLPDGSENTVRFDVVSVPNTTRNGRLYCEQPSLDR